MASPNAMRKAVASTVSPVSVTLAPRCSHSTDIGASYQIHPGRLEQPVGGGEFMAGGDMDEQARSAARLRPGADA